MKLAYRKIGVVFHFIFLGCLEKLIMFSTGNKVAIIYIFTIVFEAKLAIFQPALRPEEGKPVSSCPGSLETSPQVSGKNPFQNRSISSRLQFGDFPLPLGLTFTRLCSSQLVCGHIYICAKITAANSSRYSSASTQLLVFGIASVARLIFWMTIFYCFRIF